MEKLAYVTNTDSNDLSVVDIEKSVEIGRIPIGGSPRGGMAIDNKGIYGYVSNCAGNTVSVIDLINNREITRIPVGLAPRGVALTPHGGLMFVSNSGSADVSVVSTCKREEIARIPVGDNPRALSISPDGKYVSVPCWGADSLSVIEVNYENPIIMCETDRIALGKDARPYHAYSHSDNEHVYTANTHRHSVSVVSLLEKKLLNEIKVGYGPRAVIAHFKEPLLYVSCEASNAISVVDLKEQKEINQIEVGPTPRGMKIDESTNVLYASSFARVSKGIANFERDGNALNVIDLGKRAHVTSIKTGLGPCSINIYNPELYNKESSTQNKIKKL